MWPGRIHDFYGFHALTDHGIVASRRRSSGPTGRLHDRRGRRSAPAPVWVSPGRRPLPGLWAIRFLLQPQTRCGAAAG